MAIAKGIILLIALASCGQNYPMGHVVKPDGATDAMETSDSGCGFCEVYTTFVDEGCVHLGHEGRPGVGRVDYWICRREACSMLERRILSVDKHDSQTLIDCFVEPMYE